MKNVMKRNKKLMICMICIIMLIVSFQVIWIKDNISYEQVLNDTWNVSVDDVSYGQQDLVDYRFSDLKVGSTVSISRELKQSEINGKTLKIHDRYSYIQVYLNQEKVYEWGKSYYEDGSVLGNGYCWVVLPYVNEDQTLTIIYKTSENNAFSNLSDIRLINTEDAFVNFIKKNLINVLLIAFLFVFGIMMFFVSLTMNQYKHLKLRFFEIGIFTLESSIWLMCNTKLIELLTNDLHVICYIEYITMYATCTTIFFVMHSFAGKILKTNKYLYLGYFLIVADILLVALNVLNVAHFPKTATIYHFTATLVFVAAIIYTLISIRKINIEKNRLFLAGILNTFICILFEMGRYWYNRFVLPEDTMDLSFIPIAMIIFIMCFLFGYIHQLVENAEIEMEQKMLMKMAYTDSLTQIGNRAQCEKIIEEYEHNQKPITIINMDLDNFKEVNDIYGHTVGDQVLIKFANILKEYFKDAQSVIRMGGDEFLVIMDYLQDEKVAEMIQKFNEFVKEENKKSEEQYKIYVACGYASSDDGICSPWNVYTKADKQMYQSKHDNKLQV